MDLAKLKGLIQAPPSETYIKNSSRMVSGLFIIAGILYYPTKGYGSVIALAAALIVMFGQKLLLSQANKDFADMYHAKKVFEETQNLDYLRFIQARSDQMLKDNKVLSDKAKTEIAQLQKYIKPHLTEETE